MAASYVETAGAAGVSTSDQKRFLLPDACDTGVGRPDLWKVECQLQDDANYQLYAKVE